MKIEKKMNMATLSQTKINSLAGTMCENIYDYYRESPADFKWKKLYACNAKYCKIGELYILRSFETIVAVFDVGNKVLYDFLRYIYKYTATSAQHIAKFKNLVIDENLDTLTYNNYSTLKWRQIK